MGKKMRTNIHLLYILRYVTRSIKTHAYATVTLHCRLKEQHVWIKLLSTSCDRICEISPLTHTRTRYVQFSLPINSFINKPTNHHWHTNKSKQVCFCWDCFLRHVRHTMARITLKRLWLPLTSRHWAMDWQITGCCCYPLIWLIL